MVFHLGKQLKNECQHDSFFEDTGFFSNYRAGAILYAFASESVYLINLFTL